MMRAGGECSCHGRRVWSRRSSATDLSTAATARREQGESNDYRECRHEPATLAIPTAEQRQETESEEPPDWLRNAVILWPWCRWNCEATGRAVHQRAHTDVEADRRASCDLNARRRDGAAARWRRVGASKRDRAREPILRIHLQGEDGGLAGGDCSRCDSPRSHKLKISGLAGDIERLRAARCVACQRESRCS